MFNKLVTGCFSTLSYVFLCNNYTLRCTFLASVAIVLVHNIGALLGLRYC